MAKQLDGSRCHLVQIGLGPGDNVLDRDPAPPWKGTRAQHPPTFRHMSTVAKWSPISASAELLLKYLIWAAGTINTNNSQLPLYPDRWLLQISAWMNAFPDANHGCLSLGLIFSSITETPMPVIQYMNTDRHNIEKWRQKCWNNSEMLYSWLEFNSKQFRLYWAFMVTVYHTNLHIWRTPCLCKNSRSSLMWEQQLWKKCLWDVHSLCMRFIAKSLEENCVNSLLEPNTIWY